MDSVSTGKSFFMSAFLKKTLLKCSLVASMGISAYFLGYFWGAEVGKDVSTRAVASEPLVAPVVQELQKPAELSQLK